MDSEPAGAEDASPSASPAVRMARLSEDTWAASRSKGKVNSKVNTGLERAQLAEDVRGHTDSHNRVHPSTGHHHSLFENDTTRTYRYLIPFTTTRASQMMVVEDHRGHQANDATRPNSTSTIFASATVANPDENQIVLR